MMTPSNQDPLPPRKSRLSMTRRAMLLGTACLLAGLTSLQATFNPFWGNPAGPPHVTVMIQNLYIGAALEKVAAEPNPMLIPVRVAETLQAMFMADFPTRAGAIAREIAAAKPDFVGLAEVTRVYLQSPGDMLSTPPAQQQPANQLVLDYLDVLLKSLAAAGTPYRVVAIVDNWSIELPLYVPTGPDPMTDFRIDDARVTDHDVILVRADLPPGQIRVFNSKSGRFDAQVSFNVGGMSVPFPRGWCSVDAVIRGRPVRILNAHLESFDAGVRVAQATELLSGPARTGLPLICLGDFNTDAEGDGNDGYQTLRQGGLRDAWETLYPRMPGYTWGHDEALLDPDSGLSQRLDLILYRGASLRPTCARIFGEDPADMVPASYPPHPLLWPSDHAGVIATFRIR